MTDIALEKNGELSVLRRESREAVASIAGHIRAFVYVAQEVLRSADGVVVYVEAFEDVQSVSANERSNYQLKLREGAFSITQEAACDMLDGWANAHVEDPDAVYVYLSSQTPANTFDKKEDFKDWAAGKVGQADESVAVESIRSTLQTFLVGRHLAKFSRLRELIGDKEKFATFWKRIAWRFDLEGVDAAIADVESELRRRYKDDLDSRLRTFAWLGAIARSAAARDVKDRGWTLQRLDEIGPTGGGAIARLAAELDRADRAKADVTVEMLQEIRSLLVAAISGVPARSARVNLTPPAHINSARLDESARTLADAVRPGKVIALRGRPGDGKTEVARQLARRTKAAYVEVPWKLGGSDWVAAVSRLIQGLGGPSDALPSDPTALFDLARDHLAASNVAVVFDNADEDPPVSLRLLIPDGSQGIAVVGPGVLDVDSEFKLPAPDGAEFRAIASEAWDDVNDLDPEAVRLLDEIGESTGHGALVAKLVGWFCRPETLTADLEGFLGDVRQGGLFDVSQLDSVISKCWSILKRPERQRVLFLAAMGESEIPTEWLPARLRKGSPASWRLLDRAGVLSRGVASLVRVHRLIAQWAVAKLDLETAADLWTQLLSWARNPSDSLKMAGRETRAVVQSVRYLLRHGAIDRFPVHERALVERLYIDCVRNSIANWDAAAQEVEAVIAGRQPNEIHPASCMQLAEFIHPSVSQHSSGMVSLRAALWDASEKWLFGDGGTFDRCDEDGLVWAAARRTWAKVILRQQPEQRDRAVAVLVESEKVCCEMVSRPAARWLVELAKVRLHLTDERAGLSVDQRFELLFSIGGEGASQKLLPRYLVIEAARRALELALKGHSDHAERLSRLATGALLASADEGNYHVRLDFLGRVVRFAEIHGRHDLFVQIQSAIAALLPFARTVRRRDAISTAHVLHKSAVLFGDAISAHAIATSVDLYARHDRRLKNFDLGRAIAATRDAGRPDLAEKIFAAIDVDRTSDDYYWLAFEIAKTRRRSGDLAAGEGVLRDLIDRFPKHAAGARDELGKNLLRAGRCQEAAEVWTENAKVFFDRRQQFFGERCLRWAASLDGGGKAADALDDEQKVRMRAASLNAAEVARLGASLETSVQAILSGMANCVPGRGPATQSGSLRQSRK